MVRNDVTPGRPFFPPSLLLTCYLFVLLQAYQLMHDGILTSLLCRTVLSLSYLSTAIISALQTKETNARDRRFGWFACQVPNTDMLISFMPQFPNIQRHRMAHRHFGFRNLPLLLSWYICNCQPSVCAMGQHPSPSTSAYAVLLLLLPCRFRSRNKGRMI